MLWRGDRGVVAPSPKLRKQYSQHRRDSVDGASGPAGGCRDCVALCYATYDTALSSDG